MSAPEVKQDVDEISYTWVDRGIEVRFDRLRETDNSSIRGFIHVRSLRPDRPGRIWWSQIALTTQADRTRLCEKLDGLGGSRKDWEPDVERMFQDCAERFTAVPDPVDLADVIAPERTQYLVPPLFLLNQVNLVLADQGSTKSYLLLYLAICIASGTDSIFGPLARHGPVMVFDWETDLETTWRRARAICRGMNIPFPRGSLLYQNMGERGRIMDRSGYMRHQIRRSGAVAAIIDSLTFGAGGDLNTTEISAPTMSAIGGLGDDVTKLVTSHPPKNSRKAGNDGIDDVSVMGSGLFEFKARSIVRMKAPPRSGRGSQFVVALGDRKLSESAQAPEQFYEICFDNDEHATRLRLVDSADPSNGQAEHMTDPERILEYLTHAPYQQANTPDLARALRIPSGSIRSYTRRLAERGKIVKVGNADDSTAVWSLPQPRSLEGGQSS